MNEAKLPRWDLTPIYPDVEGPEFKGDLEKISSLSKKLSESIKTASLKELIELINEIESLVATTYPYASALLSTDTANPIYISAVGKTEKACVEFSNVMTEFTAECAKRESEFKDPALKDYQLFLSEILESSKHMMSQKEEALANEMLLVSAKQWSRLQEAVTSSISSGDKTLIDLRGCASNPDRAVRKDAFERELAILKEHEVALCYALNGVKGTALILEKRRGWKDPLDRSCFTARISRKALSALITTLEKNQPLFRRYMEIKAKIMGLKKLDWYDTVAPVGSSDKKYSFEEAEDIVIKAYTKFSPEMGAFVKNAFENGWIDAEPRKGKVGGAYDTSFYKAGVSRVLCNFDYTYDSVLTLAHELGHAYHDSIMLKEAPILGDYPMTLAESASIFGETIVFTEVVKTLSKEEQLPVIESMLSSANQVCVDILSRFYFEKACFEKRKEGELTAKDMCDMMLDAEERTYGDAVAIKHPYMWAVKSHYYIEEFSFYNYPYAFGQLFALGLFKRSADDPNFAQDYKALLSRTGRMNARDVALSAGCDIESEAFWQESIDVLAHWIDVFETYVK